MKKRFAAIILLNVLAGLLFSCGESVRLLPFPGGELRGYSASQLKETSKIPYRHNVLRFESVQPKHKTEAGRVDLRKFYSSGTMRFPDAVRRFTVPIFSAAGHDRKIPFRSLFLTGSKGSRPPPEFS
ncbi:MAG: hypothetical protein KIS76_12165 [Pyrinomonadaceae bacterium]|nr:hypothetical protein [Pyrinomonadaceae bacterium]